MWNPAIIFLFEKIEEVNYCLDLALFGIFINEYQMIMFYEFRQKFVYEYANVMNVKQEF